jgi:nucleotide-binding universal stress UspA family protein
VRWCTEVASALRAKVVAVTAFEPFLEWVPDSDARSWRHSLEVHMEDWLEPLHAAKVELELEIVRDVHPVAAIAGAAQACAQLIVVGHHGHGGISGAHLGDIGLQLVHHAGLPVVMVPTQAERLSPSTVVAASSTP